VKEDIFYLPFKYLKIFFLKKNPLISFISHSILKKLLEPQISGGDPAK
jgi:hypothetical protein